MVMVFFNGIFCGTFDNFNSSIIQFAEAFGIDTTANQFDSKPTEETKYRQILRIV